MTWTTWILILVAVYFVIGALIATVAMQTPWADNGWLWLCLLWPLVLWQGL